MNSAFIPDVTLTWSARVERVRLSQARTDTTGMTRPPRDPDERAFLAAKGQLGPFAESAVVRVGVRSVPEE